MMSQELQNGSFPFASNGSSGIVSSRAELFRKGAVAVLNHGIVTVIS
jgi:hypothetical protein